MSEHTHAHYTQVTDSSLHINFWCVPAGINHHHRPTIRPNKHVASRAWLKTRPVFHHGQRQEVEDSLLSFVHLSNYEAAEQQLQPLSLPPLSRGKAIGLAGEEARQIYDAGGDLWGRNTVMGEWLSTVSYWHLTKCPKQNEFTSLFLNHQAATALTPILTAITRSPISQGPEKFTVTSTFQWAQVSTSFTFSGAGAGVEEG